MTMMTTMMSPEVQKFNRTLALQEAAKARIVVLEELGPREQDGRLTFRLRRPSGEEVLWIWDDLRFGFFVPRGNQ
jgi:hypothetical protein